MLDVGGLASMLGGGGPQDSGLPDWMQMGGLAALMGGLKGGGGGGGDGGKGLMNLGASMLKPPGDPSASPLPGSPAGGTQSGGSPLNAQNFLQILQGQGGAQFPLLPKSLLGGGFGVG